MAGLKGKSGPPGNTNDFKHGVAAIQKRRERSINNPISRYGLFLFAFSIVVLQLIALLGSAASDTSPVPLKSSA
jgi:hypothetical protein